MLWALARLHLLEQHLGQLIMIAPDVDTEIFADLVVRSGRFARRTLYVSRHDLALQTSGWLRSCAPRAQTVRGDQGDGYHRRLDARSRRGRSLGL